MQVFLFRSTDLEQRQQKEARVMVLLGIIQQLLTTRHTHLFAGMELNQSQFGVLNHFTHAPDRSWLVTDLAEVMEMNQPGITKIVTVLLSKGYLESTADTVDKRKRHLKITKEGLGLCQKMMVSLLPDISHTLESWNDSELSQLQEHMEKLMSWLDSHRDDIKVTS